MTSHRSAALSAWQEIPSCKRSANTPAIHFLQGREGSPDLTKLFTHLQPGPVQTLSLMFSLLQEINMFGSRQTTRALPGGLFPFSGPPLGAPTADVHNRINKRRSSRVNTGHNQQRRIYTVLRINTTAHMCHTKDQHSASLRCQLIEDVPGNKQRQEY